VSGAFESRQSGGEPGSHTTVVAMLAQLARGHLAVDRPREVARYLTQHPDLIGAVQRVTRAARDRLGERAQLSLELQPDPEYRDKVLTLYVRQSAYDDDLLAVLDDIAQAQEIDPSASSGWFRLTTDFQPPR
jgi:hypothetical protein